MAIWKVTPTTILLHNLNRKMADKTGRARGGDAHPILLNQSRPR
ncbi:MAG TPA: hypothetical protein VKG25_04070 [Bryobacteraceae bacterium]|nr:hypothetical protein [Bryobacteraceae bacterium]